MAIQYTLSVEVQPYLPQPEEIKMIDQKSADENNTPAAR